MEGYKEKRLFKKNRLHVGIFLIFFSVQYCMVFAADQTKEQVGGQAQYNVVLIIVDAMRPDHLGCYGYHKKTTPAIDRLAREGIRFTNAFSQAGFTVASVMSILTSVYPKTHGVMRENSPGLSPQIYTLAEVLKKYGYFNGWFTTLNEGALKTKLGYGRGVDTVGELSASLAGKEKVLDWIVANKDRRFFLALEVRKVHDPYFPSEPFRRQFSEGKKGNVFTTEQEQEKYMFLLLSRLIGEPPQTYTGQTVHEIFKNGIDEEKAIFNKPYSPGVLNGWIDSLPESQQVPLRNGLTRETYFEQVRVSDKENLRYLVSMYDGCIVETDSELIAPIVNTLRLLNLLDRKSVV